MLMSKTPFLTLDDMIASGKVHTMYSPHRLLPQKYWIFANNPHNHIFHKLNPLLISQHSNSDEWVMHKVKLASDCNNLISKSVPDEFHELESGVYLHIGGYSYTPIDFQDWDYKPQCTIHRMQFDFFYSLGQNECELSVMTNTSVSEPVMNHVNTVRYCKYGVDEDGVLCAKTSPKIHPIHLNDVTRWILYNDPSIHIKQTPEGKILDTLVTQTNEDHLTSAQTKAILQSMEALYLLNPYVRLPVGLDITADKIAICAAEFDTPAYMLFDQLIAYQEAYQAMHLQVQATTSHQDIYADEL